MDRFHRAGLEFEVRDEGPPGGDAVVLLHGFPQDNRCYDDVLPTLHAAGMRTLTPLQRGYSPGARPAGRSAYRLEECAADILALLNAAGVATAHVVGHDWGGAVAWHLAGRHPQRLRSLVVLSTPHPQAMMAAMLRSRQALQSAYMALFQLPLLPERILPRSLERSLVRSGLPAPVARRYTERMTEPGALTAALNWYRALPWTMRTPIRAIPVRTSFIWGTEDPFLGRTAAELTARHVHAPYRLHALDGAGHWIPETRAAQLADLIVESTASADHPG